VSKGPRRTGSKIHRGESMLMGNRYILQMNVMDHAGSFWITAFNDTAEQIMAITANELMKYRVCFSVS
jgi:hypothetical protein